MKIKLVIMALLTLFASMACAFDDDLNPFNFSFNFSGGTCKEQKPDLDVDPLSYAFDNVSTQATRSTNIALTNSGNAALTDIVFQPFSSAVFSHSSSATAPCGTTLAAKATCYRQVSFTPAAATAYSDVLTISSNQLDDVAVPVNGTGVDSSGSATFDVGFNFWPAADTGTLGDGETYVLSTDITPTTRGGATFSWSATPFDMRTNAESDNRLKGHALVLSGAARTWALTLPSSGLYKIWIAAGDANSSRDQDLTIYDNSTLVASITASTLAYQFSDATGTPLYSAAWVAASSYGGNPITILVESTTLNFVLNATGAGVTSLNHIRVQKQ